MKFSVVVVLVPVVWALVASDPSTSSSSPTTKSTTVAQVDTVAVTTAAPKNNGTSNNGTRIPVHKSKGFDMDSSMIQRALYVLTGFTIIGILFKVVRRKKPSVTHRKKYGLLSNQDNMEMGSMESDEDDTTLYEARTLRR
ncbi:protein FAM174C [Engraulis encrasicolus]|uniref:protein FAM174C n=1 Tax=Engraulis encrasicolus TaxID=184585 RepID=UPI002FD74346